MKRSDLSVGLVVALTTRAGSHGRRVDGLPPFKAEVIEWPCDYPGTRPGGFHSLDTTRDDGVRIRWIVEPDTSTGHTFNGSQMQYPGVPVRHGDEGVVPIRLLWMPWAEYAERRAAMLQREAAAKAAADADKTQAERLHGRLGVGALTQLRGASGWRVLLTLDDVAELLGRDPDIPPTPTPERPRVKFGPFDDQADPLPTPQPAAGAAHPLRPEAEQAPEDDVARDWGDGFKTLKCGGACYRFDGDPAMGHGEAHYPPCPKSPLTRRSPQVEEPTTARADVHLRLARCPKCGFHYAVEPGRPMNPYPTCNGSENPRSITPGSPDLTHDEVPMIVTEWAPAHPETEQRLEQ